MRRGQKRSCRPQPPTEPAAVSLRWINRQRRQMCFPLPGERTGRIAVIFLSRRTLEPKVIKGASLANAAPQHQLDVIVALQYGCRRGPKNVLAGVNRVELEKAGAFCAMEFKWPTSLMVFRNSAKSNSKP